MASHTIKRKIERRNAIKNGGCIPSAHGADTLGELLDRLAHAQRAVEVAIEADGRDAPISDMVRLVIAAMVGGETLADASMRLSVPVPRCNECRRSVHHCRCHTGRYTAVVGQSYRTQAGDTITVLGRSDNLWGYETLICSDGRHRYDRSYQHEDAGRVTGTEHDYSCPHNIKWDAFSTVSVEEG